MTTHSAGIIPYRFSGDRRLRVLLGHMGGPFWSKKDIGGWSIVKGEVEQGEDDLVSVAIREFLEETGYKPSSELNKIGEFRQPSGKVIHAWRCVDDWDLSSFKPGAFEMEWPKGSGRMQSFPEMDKIAWMDILTAKAKILKGQIPILEQLASQLDVDIESMLPEDLDPQGSLF